LLDNNSSNKTRWFLFVVKFPPVFWILYNSRHSTAQQGTRFTDAHVDLIRLMLTPQVLSMWWITTAQGKVHFSFSSNFDDQLHLLVVDLQSKECRTQMHDEIDNDNASIDCCACLLAKCSGRHFQQSRCFK